MHIKGAAQHQFATVADVKIQRSKFNRSHNLKTTFDAGYLIPVFWDEAVPGDSFNLKMTAFTRLATPLKPIMDNLYLDTFFFAVPIRLIWDNWQKFNGERANPTDSIDFSVPQIQSGATGFAEGELSDYFGLPVGLTYQSYSAFWHRAYNLIYNEWFRSEVLIPSLPVPKGNGPDTIGTQYLLRKRNKRFDYFTSCLPWAQKGDAVTIPFASEIPVLGTGTSVYMNDGSSNAIIVNDKVTTPSGTADGILANPFTPLYATADMKFGVAAAPHAGTGLRVDLSGAIAPTINALREAFQIQKLLERDARSGSRYVETIKAHFGVVCPDYRLMRPEYLGGGTSMINISPIAQTVPVSGGTPLANLAAVGTSTLQHGFTKSFTEHCVLIGLASARADLNYQQGVNKMWSRLTRYDFYWPAFSHLGEQAVLSKEIYTDGTSGDTTVFGYQERYAEMRYKPSTLTGKMRSAATGSLDVWHLAQDFSTRPVLGQAFIEENPPMTRVIAVPSEPHFIMDAYFDLVCVRPMPVYSVPGLIDHF